MYKLIKNFFFEARTEGWIKAFRRLYVFLKQNKYLRFFLIPAFFTKNLFLGTIKKIKKRFHLSHREKRLKKIKITPSEAKRQVGKLTETLKDEGSKNLDRKPSVSIIIPNRNGLKHLERLAKSLRENTKYPDYEIIIVDNASADGSLEFLEKNGADLPLRIIRNKENVSFSRGCNQGAEMAKGDLLVFMNNDIRVLPGWLENMVDCYLRNIDEAGSIGAKLIYPEKERFKLSNRIQHIGIKFEFDSDDGFYRPYNFGMGESVSDYEKETDYPALTAALLMVPKDRFEEVGGFDEKYFYGYEDVDLGLKLHKTGYRNISCPKVCAFHYEFGTQKKDRDDEVAERRRLNMEIFKKRWHLFLARKIFEDRLESRNFYCEENLTACFLCDRAEAGVGCSEALELGRSMRKMAKWNLKLIDSRSRRRYSIGDEADILISFSDSYDIRKIRSESPKLVKIAWTGDDFKKWIKKEYLGSFDMIISSEASNEGNILEAMKRKIHNFPEGYSYEEKIKKLIGIIKEKNSKSKISIKIATSAWDEANSWGDYHFSLSLEKYFKRKGWETAIHILPDWETNFDNDCEAVLVLRGLSKYDPKPRHFNMMWNISHPDAVKMEEYESYDKVFIASRFWADKIKKEAKNAKIETMLQCTDCEVFKIPEEHELEEIDEENILFVGNSRKKYRKSVRYSIESGFDVAVYGKLWEDFIDEKHIRGNYLSNDELYRHYHSTKVLLNDHWDDMAEKGFVSNRIFDGMASGAILITDYVKGLEEEEFSQFLEVYGNKDDFSKKLRAIIENNAGYKDKARKAAESVAQKHTFEKRVERFIEAIRENIKF